MESTTVAITEIMSTDVVTVTPDTPLVDAASIIVKHNFDGVPVVDTENKLVGILTEYDLISKGSMLHLPTLQIVLKNLTAFRKDRSQFEKEINDVAALKVKDVMDSNPLTLPETATFEDAETVFRKHRHVNPIPVIDKERRVVGVISRFDLFKPLHNLR